MVVHSTGVQWPAPHQGPHLLICGSPLPGKYAGPCFAGRPRGECRSGAGGEIVVFKGKKIACKHDLQSDVDHLISGREERFIPARAGRKW